MEKKTVSLFRLQKCELCYKHTNQKRKSSINHCKLLLIFLVFGDPFFYLKKNLNGSLNQKHLDNHAILMKIHTACSMQKEKHNILYYFIKILY